MKVQFHFTLTYAYAVATTAAARVSKVSERLAARSPKRFPAGFLAELPAGVPARTGRLHIHFL